MNPPPIKSTVDEIRARFDRDVERFSNLETGQAATIDAPLTLELATRAAAATTPAARHLLDLGCGAGNYSIQLLQYLPGLDVSLVDLSQPMLDRACQRVGAATSGRVLALRSDVRELEPQVEEYDIILAAAVFHHLRTDAEWKRVFEWCHRALRPGGSLWIVDLVSHAEPAVQELMWRRYGDYLVALGGADYRDEVFSYIEKEDTPRSVGEQLEWLREAGFRSVDVLHKNSCFAAIGAVKGGRGA